LPLLEFLSRNRAAEDVALDFVTAELLVQPHLFRAALPFLFIMLIWLAFVTYLPELSLWWKSV